MYEVVALAAFRVLAVGITMCVRFWDEHVPGGRACGQLLSLLRIRSTAPCDSAVPC